MVPYSGKKSLKKIAQKLLHEMNKTNVKDVFWRRFNIEFNWNHRMYTIQIACLFSKNVLQSLHYKLLKLLLMMSANESNK